MINLDKKLSIPEREKLAKLYKEQFIEFSYLPEDKSASTTFYSDMLDLVGQFLELIIDKEQICRIQISRNNYILFAIVGYNHKTKKFKFIIWRTVDTIDSFLAETTDSLILANILADTIKKHYDLVAYNPKYLALWNKLVRSDRVK